MPIYEFHCPDCGSDFETLVLKSGEKVACPECDCAKVQRLMSGFAHKSEGGPLVSADSGCGTCSGGTCSSCH
jgi:putative FmdB family regulatory protein